MSNIERGPVRERRWAEWFGPVDLGFVVLLLIALVYLIHEGHGNKLFFDEWTWVETRHSGLSAILDSYNEHEEIVPLAVYQLLFHTVGLDSYHWYRLLATLGHLAAVTAIYVFARTRIGPLALLVAIPLLFLGAGWEFILWGANFGFTTSIALAIAALIWLDSDDRPSFVGCLLLVASLLCAETAVLFAIGLAVELTWRDRSLRRAWVWAVPIVLYVVWYIGFFQSLPGKRDIGALPTFGAQLAAGSSGGLFGQGEGLGWVILGLIAVLLVFRLVRCRAFTPRFIAVLLTVLGYWALVAIGRSALGDPTASRYVYSGGVLLALVVIESLRGVRIDWRVLLVFVVVCGLALDGGIHAFKDGAGELFEGSNDAAADVTALQLLKGHVSPDFVLDPHWAPQITPALYFPAVADLHSTGADTMAQFKVTPEEERSDADEVLIRAGEITATQLIDQPAGGAVAPTVEFQLDGAIISRSAGCLTYRPSGTGSTIDLTLPPSGLTLHTFARISPKSPQTQVRVRRFASGYENGPIDQPAPFSTLLIRARADADPQGWHVRLSPWETIRACTVPG